MSARMLPAGSARRVACILLSIWMAVAPSAAAIAQVDSGAEAAGAGAAEVDLQDRLHVEVPQPAERTVRNDTTLLAEPGAGKIDTTYVSPQAVLILAARPKQALTGPGAVMMPVEVATAAGLEYLGIDPADVVELVAFVEPPLSGPPQYGVALWFAKPFQGANIKPEIRAHTQPGELEGRRYLQSTQPQMPSFYMPDDRLMLIAPDATLRQLLASKDAAKDGPLFDRVRAVPATNDLYAAVDVQPLRPLIGLGLIQKVKDLPAEAAPYLQIPNHIRSVELTVNVTTPGPTSLVAHANDEASADELAKLIDSGLELWHQKFLDDLSKQATSDDLVQKAYAHYLERVCGIWTEQVRPRREGTSFVLCRVDSTDPGAQQTAVLAPAGVLAALLLPALTNARGAARQAQSKNNMKMLMLAMHNYHDTRKSFPAHANYSDDGKPLLSWRVHVLPFLEEGTLYEQFHLDEPWDSEHNKQLIPLMPEVFHNPSLELEPGKTDYLAVVGKDCFLDGTDKGLHIRFITDGTSKTAALVEADAEEAAIWTKPDDWEFDPAKPKRGLGGVQHGGWLVALVDGSVRLIPQDIDDTTVKALFTRNGGEAFTLNR